jgi:hypothetical protein
MFVKKAVRYYYIVTLLSFLLWIPFPELSYIFRINSPIFAFLCGVGSESVLILLAAFIWILIFFGLFITGIVLAEKCNIYFPFVIICGVDLLISFFILLFRPHATYIEWPMFVGLLFHCLHYAAVLVRFRKERLAARTKGNST